jgi:hypothetical protein
MKQLIGMLLFTAFISGLSSCFKTSISKPDNLIPKDKFVKMMVDVYLIQGINSGSTTDKVLKKITQTDLYYSLLKKYSVADTVFIRSLLYYSSFPKEYEKMHLQITNILNESELQFTPADKLKLGKE